MTPSPNNELRKAWLKKKFVSWEYHEELLKLHDEYLSALMRHWADPETQKKISRLLQTMKSPIFFNFDKAGKPGETARSSWQPGKTVGWASTISYNFNRGMSDFGPPFTEYAGMGDRTIAHLNSLVGKMLRMCENIELTVENRWFDKDEGNDDDILYERYTGPIDWPPNWQGDVETAATSLPNVASVKAGQRSPESGWWFTPAKESSRRYFKQGDLFPNVEGSAYGATFWQWSPDQSSPKLQADNKQARWEVCMVGRCTYPLNDTAMASPEPLI